MTARLPQRLAFPEELSAPFAGRGEWTYCLRGGPIDGAESLQGHEFVVRRMDVTKWHCPGYSAMLYQVVSIDRAEAVIHCRYVQHAWSGR